MKKGLLLLLLWAAPILAADPVVENVRVSQRNDGSRLADIYYDVSDADGDTLAVSVQASDDDGATWLYPVRTLSGDVGPGVAPGSDRHIVWDLAADGVELSGHALRVRVIASDRGIPHPVRSPYRVGVHAWNGIDWNDPDTYERLARSDILVLTASNLWGVAARESANVIERLKSHNPDLKVLAYVLAKTTVLGWDQSNSSFARRWWEETRPYWSYTTTGDTLSDWPHQVVVNILDPGCRQAIVDLIVEYQRHSPLHFDGVFWDYFNSGGIWIPDYLDVDGEPDLDGDGIPTPEDPQERRDYNDACEWMVTALRDSLGGSFLQIFNGQRAYADSAFAALSDGMNYELFPTLRFPADRNMAAALDPSYPYNLFRVQNWPRSEAGGPYLLLENIHDAEYVDTAGQRTVLEFGDLFRAVALLLDHAVPVWGGHIEDWPDNDFSLGPPLGPPMIDGDRYSRNFRYGRLELEMTTGKLPNPFHYTVWVNGRVVEQLAVPYHYP